MIEHNGKKYARVSDVIREDFSSIDKEILERKAALGTNVHNAIEQEIKGNFPLVQGKEYGYFHSFELWAARVNPTFLMMEKRIYCDKKMLTGQIDAIIKLEGEEKGILVDWKTSAQESPLWINRAHLYYYLLKEAGIDASSRFLFVKLDREGDWPRVFEYKLDSRLLGQCLQAVDAFWRKNVATNS